MITKFHGIHKTTTKNCCAVQRNNKIPHTNKQVAKNLIDIDHTNGTFYINIYSQCALEHHVAAPRHHHNGFRVCLTSFRFTTGSMPLQLVAHTTIIYTQKPLARFIAREQLLCSIWPRCPPWWRCDATGGPIVCACGQQLHITACPAQQSAHLACALSRSFSPSVSMRRRGGFRANGGIPPCRWCSQQRVFARPLSHLESTRRTWQTCDSAYHVFLAMFGITRKQMPL